VETKTPLIVHFLFARYTFCTSSKSSMIGSSGKPPRLSNLWRQIAMAFKRCVSIKKKKREEKKQKEKKVYVVVTTTKHALWNNLLFGKYYLL
jgi:L-fucose mutarotase/ribose pyranase (RbsD/FucU family)